MSTETGPSWAELPGPRSIPDERRAQAAAGNSWLSGVTGTLGELVNVYGTYRAIDVETAQDNAYIPDYTDVRTGQAPASNDAGNITINAGTAVTLGLVLIAGVIAYKVL